MRTFTIHTEESAPEKSKQALNGLKQAFGMIPNVAATMAGSPALINSFVTSFGNFHSGSFNESEKQVVLLSDAVALKCPWTVAFHSTMALREGVSPDDVKAIRDGKAPSNPKYAALSGIAKALIEKKGNAGEGDIERFVAAGYSHPQILEVITAIGVSTMAAMVGNVAGTPVEDVFKAQTWAAA